ncbi:hypothetical protein BDB00DRAFT_752815 [Zychaea mexicana]|uniref:uncharacterized protein n=1 Tax=Zychaea mexicana TaxID=64656 RepID=UPI0022FDC5E8|nr:uncharacterized protein BDB00DRAFT_752815 [Zychaea mexicana]KAI9499451.1 hypothetical protein BDB00DRAFT_752815 [Zychaea mexicana]
MRGRAKSGKTIDIVLNEEKFYFPGDSLQDKETITLFQRTQNIRASPGDKACILEAKQHSFAFNFEVPKGIELPSTMEFARKAKVRYVLTAIHDRPMVPESFCPKAQYVVPILEYLDIEAPQFRIPQEKTAKAPSLSSKQCQLKMSIPRTGFARGDIVTIHIIVTCSESLVVNKGLRLDLVRMADIRSGRHQFVKEDVLKTTEHDLNMIGPYNFSQAISCQMPIPTSTPPTIGYDGMTLRMYYQIRAKVRLTDIIEKPKTVTLELPIVVGTWPLADIPIDDDDDDDDDSLMIAPHIALTPKEDTVDRSDSKSSKRSASSWRSNQSWDSQPLSRNTSLTTPDKLSSSSSFARTPSVTEPPVLPPPQPAPLPTNNNNNNNNNRNNSSDDDSSDDDGDLLRIVRKKKKAEQKRQRQSMRL